MTTERQFATSDNWALGADNLQWILYRAYQGGWRAISFVSSERDILERCMREKGCSELHRAVLLAGLPSTFKEWQETTQCAPPDPSR